ncbi:MAG: hypothetical protein WAN11_20455 [Syntrophobacteraceae bacterium]
MEKVLRSAVLLVCLAALLLTCLQILGHGYSPVDDALRHVAKVISGKEWQDILVVREEITMDSHPGWHFILKQVARLTGSDATLLLDFSVLSLFLLFVFPPVFLFKRPEAWISSLLIFSVFSFVTMYRLFYGRPFIFSMFLVLVFCFLWTRIRDRKAPIPELAVFAIISALSTWIHGAWYLLALPICALGLARQWRVSALMTAAMVAGILLGATFTGRPLIFLHQMIYHALLALGHIDFQRQLVSEFRPFDGAPAVVTVVAAMLIWRTARGQWNKECVDNPVFILGVLGWTLGFVASRFWSDWGWPAVAFWTAVEIEEVMKRRLGEFEPRRLVVAVAVCLTLFLGLSNDRGSRWTAMIGVQWPNMTTAEHRQWLPEPEGILYSDGMDVFYSIFYNNPHGEWKYVLGFEPVWMPDEDLKIYRNIEITRGKPASFAPWVEKMTQKDRLVLVRTEEPKIEGLEWHEVTPTVWSGRRAEGMEKPAKDERVE